MDSNIVRLVGFFIGVLTIGCGHPVIGMIIILISLSGIETD